MSDDWVKKIFKEPAKTELTLEDFQKAYDEVNRPINYNEEKKKWDWLCNYNRKKYPELFKELEKKK